jgi:glycosyltransferase involved in cell wall biosynthesis
MKVALVTPAITSSERLYGAEKYFLGLHQGLREIADADWLQVPISEATFDDVLQGYLDCFDLDVSRYDVVISTKVPTFMVQHPRHICWLVHQIRVFYDRFEDEYGRLPRKLLAENEERRELIRQLDDQAFSHIGKIFAIGHETARRLKHYNGLDAEVIHPPVLGGDYYCSGQDYLLLPGRLHRWKRVDLGIRALKSLPGNMPLLIAGSGEDEDFFKEVAGQDPRIRFLGYVSDDELAGLYANALAVLFLPKDEDFGYITVEAMLSHKPVITCTDSGEPSRLVEHGRTGLVVPPTVEGVSEAIRVVNGDRQLARQFGENGYAAAPRNTWVEIAQRLLHEADSRPARPQVVQARQPATPKVLVADNQILDPPTGGGRLRIYQLFRHIAARGFDVSYVGAYDWPGPAFRDQMLSPRFREIVTPLTEPHFAVNRLIQFLAGGKTVIDVTMPYLLRFSPRFARIADEQAQDAKVIIISHPWVYRYVPRRADQVLIYDAHNCESTVKRQILGEGLVGRLLVGGVTKAEAQLCRDADIIFACSPEDADQFVKLYGVSRDKIVLVENGVDVAEIRPVAEDENRRAKLELKQRADVPLLIFIGSGYQPNTEAATFLVEHLAPQFPDCKFLIVGSVRDSYHRKRNRKPAPANVEWTGTVDEQHKLLVYRAADIALNPMFSGSGTNLKMLDYFAAGLPVVSTVAGARGLEVTENECIICAAEEFAGRISGLLANGETRKQMGKCARIMAERRYAWENIAERACSALLAAVSAEA